MAKAHSGTSRAMDAPGRPVARGEADLEDIASRRLLLCRPQGGLNDMMSQIERCCRYAENTGRAVIVDTNFENETYGDEFDRYFASRQSRLHLDARDYYPLLDRASVYPGFLQGRVSSYRSVMPAGGDDPMTLERESGLPLTFDFRKEYPHQLLVHHQLGRVSYSFAAFLRMSLQRGLIVELVARLRKIGGPYLGVHVRHTDYKSNYAPVLEEVAAAQLQRVFVATDNHEVLEAFRTSLPNKEIHSFTEELSVDGKPLHLNRPKTVTVFRRNSDAILDLLVLALSARIVSSNILNGRRGFTKSGFAVLAEDLAKHKRILSELLGGALKFGLD
jgi:hypothetical protein